MNKSCDISIKILTFGTIFGTKKKNNKKTTQAGGVGNQHLPLALSTIL